MKYKKYLLIIVLLICLTSCDKKSGTMICKTKDENLIYSIEYKDNEVKKVNINYKDYKTNDDSNNKNSLESIMEYQLKYCSNNIKGASCSTNALNKYFLVKMSYDYEKLSDKELKKLEKDIIFLNSRKIDKLTKRITKNIDNIECTEKEDTKQLEKQKEKIDK